MEVAEREAVAKEAVPAVVDSVEEVQAAAVTVVEGTAAVATEEVEREGVMSEA